MTTFIILGILTTAVAVYVFNEISPAFSKRAEMVMCGASSINQVLCFISGIAGLCLAYAVYEVFVVAIPTFAITFMLSIPLHFMCGGKVGVWADYGMSRCPYNWIGQRR